MRNISVLILLILLTGFFIGCSARTVQTELPLSHPAHPQAVESVYNPPPDTFQNSRTESQPSSAGHGSPEMDHSDKPHTGHGQ